MQKRILGADDIAMALRSKQRLEPLVKAVEMQDAKIVAKHLAKVLPGDDGLLCELFMSDLALLNTLKAHL
jgi:hypothetical protein